MAARGKKKRVHDEFSSSEDETDSDFEDPDEIEVPGGGRNLKTLQEHVVAGPSSSGKGPGGGGKAKAKTGGSGDGDVQIIGTSSGRSLLRNPNPGGLTIRRNPGPSVPVFDVPDDDPSEDAPGGGGGGGIEVLKVVPGRSAMVGVVDGQKPGGSGAAAGAAAGLPGFQSALNMLNGNPALLKAAGAMYNTSNPTQILQKLASQDGLLQAVQAMQNGDLSRMLSPSSPYGAALGGNGLGMGPVSVSLAAGSPMTGPMLVGSAQGGGVGGMPGMALQSKQISDLWRTNVHPIMRTVPGGGVSAPGDDEEVAAEDEEDMGVIETYSNYMPSKLKIGKPHPDPVVETASLASVEPPDVWYTPELPDDIIDRGKLSALQLEALVYTCQQHEQFLPDGNRAGFLVGDGAGVGKGRTIAGIIYENYCQGRKRAVWVSVSNDLKYDAERDLSDIGASKVEVHFLSKMKYAKINSSINGNVSKGVMYSTYSALIGESQGGGKYKTRLKQLLHWCGDDFDGVIVFDECHRAKNLCPTGAGKPTKTGLTVLELQQRLPKARIVYASATGASEPKHMAYMVRLGIWGPGSPFPNFDAFLKGVEKRGVGAMEIVAMDMKLRGMYIARQLSFQGVGFRVDEVELSPDFRRVYDRSVEVWVDLLHKFTEAASLIDADKKMRKTMWGQFWSSHQRFFKYLCIAAKVKHVIRVAAEVIKAGKCVVIGLQSTGEARTLEAVEREEELSDFVSTAKGVLQSLVEKHFPAPDRDRINRLLGIGGPQRTILDELGIKTDKDEKKTGAAGKRKAQASAGAPGKKKAKIAVVDNDSDSDFQLTDEEEDDDDEDTDEDDFVDVDEEEDEFNPFGAGSDDEDPWAKRNNKKKGKAKPKKKQKKKLKKKPEAPNPFAHLVKKDEPKFNNGSPSSASIAQPVPPSSSSGPSSSAAVSQSNVDRACALKAEVLRKIERLGSELPANTLDQLIDELGGPENVSEMTGRKGRVVQDTRGDVRYESRSEQDVPLETLNLAEKDRFMSGEKCVAVISEAASSGISLQADRRVRNRKRRVHMTLELPWSADRAIQQFGRTHRSNQTSAPEYILLISDLAGEHRFASIVAKRLESLGALTHGDRRATESRDLSRFNIDNKYGRAALEAVFRAIMGYEAPILPPPATYQGDFFKDIADGLVGVGLITQSEDSPGMIVLDKGHNDMSKFLNRILGLKVDLQNLLFRYFSDTLAAIISNAKRIGTYDQGILDVGLTEEDKVELVRTHTFMRKHATGEAKIELHVLQVERGLSWQGAQDKWEELVGADEGFYLSHQARNGKKTAILAIALDQAKTASASASGGSSKSGGGKRVKMYVIYRPNTGQQVKQESLADLRKKYRKVCKDEAEPHWNQQFNSSAQRCSHAYWKGNCKTVTFGLKCEVGLRRKTYNVLAGSVLSVWTQVEQVLTYDGNRRGASSRMQVVRLKLESGKRIVGTLIPSSALRVLVKTLSDGAEESEETIY